MRDFGVRYPEKLYRVSLIGQQAEEACSTECSILLIVLVAPCALI